MQHRAAAGAIVLSTVFFLIASHRIDEPGLQADETLFGMGVFYPQGVQYKAKVFGRTVPLMQMSYLGSFKAWVYAPVFAVWAPSAASVRIPAIVFGAATVALTFLLMWWLAGPAAAWVAGGLLAVDPTFVWTTRCDWGPVALEHLLLMGGVVAFYRRRLGWGGLLFGLALWHKATFLWALAGLGVAAMVFALWRHMRTPRALVLLVLGFAVGAYPVIRFNVSTRGRTAEQTARWESENLGGKWLVLQGTLDGAALYGYTVPQRRPEVPGVYESGFSWVVGAAALVVVARRNRVGLFFLLAAAVAWLAMAFTYGAGGSAHHVVLLWPWPQCIVGAAVASLWTAGEWARRAAICVAVVAMALGLAVTVQHYRVLAASGAEPPWSDAVYALRDRVEALVGAGGGGSGAAGVYATDWGIMEPLRVLTAGRVPLEYALDFPLQGTAGSARALTGGWIFVGHVAGKEAFAGVNQRFDAAAAAAIGLTRETVAVVRDRQGRDVFEIFRYRRFDTMR